ncbi:MAG: sulfurtransferase [Proteobacteria bacterium]|nr:sulfurtransferase [Pseudomonadota bacterium]
MTSALITPSELHKILSQPHVRVLDATYGIPGYPSSVLAQMEGARIRGAQFFDIDAVADGAAPYPHTLPDAATFEAAVGALGISNEDTVVIFDQNGLSFAAARVWWMFRVFGHDKVHVLNGGLPAWKMAGLPLESGPLSPPAPQIFRAQYRPALYRDFDAIESGGDTILDARAAPRFDATIHSRDGDPMPAHIEGSFNVPFQSLLDHAGALRPAGEIHPLLEPYLAARSLVCSCGSGVTACVVALALHEAGRLDVAVYDGSWTEWSDRQGLR